MGERIRQYFQELQNAINDENYDDIIDISTEILRFMPDDPDALKCRGLAYINTKQFDEALQDYEKLKDKAYFEKAYCLYSLGRNQDCLKFITSLDSKLQSQERFIKLRAQTHLKLDQAKECLAQYKLIPKDEMEYYDYVNICAANAIEMDATAALETEEIGMKVKDDDVDGVEILYNTALACADCGNYEKAHELIKLGLSKTKPSSMYGQLLTLLETNIVAKSDEDKAASQYELFVDSEESHPYVKQIAASNFVALTGEKNVHNARKRMTLFDDTESYKSNRKNEIEAFFINTFLVYQKIGQSKSKVSKLIDRLADFPVDHLLSESLMQTLDPSAARDSQYTPLFVAQNLIQQKKFGEAAQSLVKSSLIQHPRTIAVVVELFAAANDLDAAIQYLQSSKLNTAAFYEFATNFSIAHGRFDIASVFADKFAKASNNSPQAVALQVDVLAETDIELAERRAQRLKAIDTSGIDFDELEQTQIKRGRQDASSVQEDNPLPRMFEVSETKKTRKPNSELSPEKLLKRLQKKKRRRRLQKPENYDPTRHMDPERWIRKSKRMGARRVKNQPKKGAKANPTKVEQAKAGDTAQPATPPPQQQKAKKNASKKKRKGGW